VGWGARGYQTVQGCTKRIPVRFGKKKGEGGSLKKKVREERIENLRPKKTGEAGEMDIGG